MSGSPPTTSQLLSLENLLPYVSPSRIDMNGIKILTYIRTNISSQDLSAFHTEKLVCSLNLVLSISKLKYLSLIEGL
jgi:hypothetical protein